MDKDKFKYDVIKESSVEPYEELPKHFLADTLEEAEELYNEFFALLNNLSYSYSISTGIDKADLFGQALVGLSRASRDYDDERSDKFKNFAIYKIKSALNDYVRKNRTAVVTPAYIANANRHIELLKDLGVEPYNLIRDKKLELEKVSSRWVKDKAVHLLKMLNNAANRANISTKELIRRAEFMPTVIRYDEYMSPDEILQENTDKMYLSLLVENIKDRMDKRELQIAEGVMNGKSYEQIGEELTPSVSSVRVHQILKEFGKKLEKKGINFEL